MLLPRDLLTRCARNFPDKYAYHCGDVSRSWREMNSRGELLAIAMVKMGFKQGAVSAFLGKESLGVYEHFFACMKIGAVRLGLNWRYSAVEMEHILFDSGALMLIIDASCAEQLNPLRTKLDNRGVLLVGYGEGHGLSLDYETLLADAARSTQTLTLPHLDPDDALMLTYTSGTTGRPKGVLHRQSSITAMIFQSIMARGLSPDDIWYTAAASSWVTVVLNMLGLGNGMTHVISNGAFEICGFLRDVERRRATALMLVPTLIQRALEELAKAPYDLSSMRLLMYGSSPASPSLIEATYKAFGCEMIQSYGMTEVGWTTQLSAADHRLAIAGEPGLLRSVGRPGVMSEIEIRDEEGHVLPPLTPGNVWIRSETLMKGYHNLPQETKQALIEGWLCTNDVGYLDARGYLFLTDRRKFMIISGAVNIFPSSVENALLEHKDVVEAAVVGASHPQWGEAVVAVVRLRQLETVQASQLHAHCEQRLNSIERPKHILFVEDFPRSLNGKVQKQKVKEWVAAQQQAMPWNVSNQKASPKDS